MSSVARLATCSDDAQQLERGHETIARRVALAEDDVAGLLAAEHGTMFAHGLEHVAIAHLVVMTSMSSRFIASWKPKLAMTVDTTRLLSSRPRSLRSLRRWRAGNRHR